MQRIRVGGAWEEVSERRVYQGGGWRIVRKAWVYASGAWRNYYIGAPAISLSFTPDPLSATSVSDTTVSGSATVTATGGLAPFAYSWTVLSFTAGATPTIANGTTAMPTFTQTGVLANSTEFAVFRVTVTDSAAQSATADLDANFTHIDFS